MFININDIKNGMTIIMDGNLCTIQEFQHVKPGKGSAFMKMKLRNLRTGALVEDTYNTNIKIEKAMKSVEPIITLVIGLIIGLFIIAMVIPMFDAINSIQ